MTQAADIAGSLGVGGVGAVVGAAFLKLAETYLAKRRTPEELAAAVLVAAQAHMGGMRQDFDDLREELRQVKKAHADEMKAMRAQHADCERRVAALTSELTAVKQATGLTPPPRRTRPRKDTP